MTLLFLHGLGESGQCFQEVFEERRFDNCNIIVPDLIGYGKSSESANGDYSFKAHIEKLWKIIADLKVHDLIVIGHSMGGDIGTLLCASDKKDKIVKFVNIEGGITQYDLFISQEAVKAAEADNFNRWFHDELMTSKVLEDWGQKYPSCRRYYSSLHDCSPEAFLVNAGNYVRGIRHCRVNTRVKQVGYTVHSQYQRYSVMERKVALPEQSIFWKRMNSNIRSLTTRFIGL